MALLQSTIREFRDEKGNGRSTWVALDRMTAARATVSAHREQILRTGLRGTP